jgi:hypothetical protein
MYEEPLPPAQGLKNLELPSHPSLFRNATVPPGNVIYHHENDMPPVMRPYASNLEIVHDRKRSRDDSGEYSTDSAESASTTRPPTNHNSFNHEPKRRTVDTDKTEDTINGSSRAFVTAPSIASGSSASVNNLNNQPLDKTAQLATATKEFTQPIPPQNNSESSEPDWSTHPNAWGYLQSLNDEYPSKYLERKGAPKPDGNERAGYMLGRSDRCEIRYVMNCQLDLFF